MQFRLLIGFIERFDAALDYALQVTMTHTLVFTSASSLPLLSSCFQRRTYPFLWVPKLSLCLTYQLLIVTAHKD
jgi:hypothetical protein